MRATFFVATSFVTERRLYWWERISQLLGEAKHRTAVITYPHKIPLDLDDAKRTRKTLTDVVKNTLELDVDRFLDELGAALGVPWDREIEARHSDNLIMSWDQIRGLVGAGMDVESHGRRHRVLQTLDAATLEDELTGSREDLEAQLGRPVRVIAYPVGRRINGEQHIRDALTAAGYQIGMSNASGVNRWLPPSLRALAQIDRFDLRRLATDRQMSHAMYFAQVAVPQLAYVSNYND
jgi:peptidoglycan/xylan/chitin deacetylase (PgdA/CDA1 family)